MRYGLLELRLRNPYSERDWKNRLAASYRSVVFPEGGECIIAPDDACIVSAYLIVLTKRQAPFS
jgi:hypothetical protein